MKRVGGRRFGGGLRGFLVLRHEASLKPELGEQRLADFGSFLVLRHEASLKHRQRCPQPPLPSRFFVLRHEASLKL